MNGPGRVLPVSPLEAQNQIDLPLDGSLSRLYLRISGWTCAT